MNAFENWRRIDDVPGDYWISDRGNVGTERSGRIRLLHPCLKANGYLRVTFAGSVERYVHLLVAKAFLGLCPSGWRVRHVDDNKQNNIVTNLEYASRKHSTMLAKARGTFRAAPLKGKFGVDNPLMFKLSESARKLLVCRIAMGEEMSAITNELGIAYSTLWNAVQPVLGCTRGTTIRKASLEWFLSQDFDKNPIT